MRNYYEVYFRIIFLCNVKPALKTTGTKLGDFWAEKTLFAKKVVYLQRQNDIINIRIINTYNYVANKRN